MWLSLWSRRLLAIGLCAVTHGIVSPAHAEIRTEFLMNSDPMLNVPDPVRNFNPALKSLWLEALERPEADMQRLAAETIARGHQFGVPELIEAVPRLEGLLRNDKSHPATRFAAARALIVLESRASSDTLLQVSQKYEADLRELVEPALAKWNFAPAVAVWKARLTSPETRLRDFVLALRGLAQVRDSSAISGLTAIVLDETRRADVRLEAALAAGQCAASGLEADAGRLAHSKPKSHSINSICACRLLTRHDSEAARTLLTELSSHAESVVAASALRRLLEIDSTLVLPLAEAAISHSDPRVRQVGASACGQHPTPERIVLLARLLADPHPAVRQEVCDSLLRLSEQPELAEVIRANTLVLLSHEAWQGQEQAALLAGKLAYQLASSRLVELLDSPRAEVRIASAWALGQVAVPETIPAMIDQARRQTALRRQSGDPTLDKQVSYLCEALGVLKAEAAVPLLLEYIPKDKLVGESPRCAAIWALGHIKAGQRDTDLEEKLLDRIRDFSDVDPERDSIKEKSAVTLARMKAVDRAPQIREIAESYKLEPRLGVALRWAVRELTGEELPPVEPRSLPTGSWFLEPFTR